MRNSNAIFVKSDSITFKYAKGASDMSGKEFHAYHEIIFFIGEKATFISENIHTILRPNSLVVIPAETYHQLLIIGSQEKYYRCVFHFGDIEDLEELISLSMGKVLLIDMNQQLQYLFDRMISLTENPHSEEVNSTIMKSVLTLLLSEIVRSDHSNREAALPNTLSGKCAALISKYIANPITVDTIAKELNVSTSYLSHTFKNQMNISIHQYILKKRLVMAYHKIQNGEQATKAAIECGFNDYSGFYKQFKKMFDKSPSGKKREIDNKQNTV